MKIIIKDKKFGLTMRTETLQTPCHVDEIIKAKLYLEQKKNELERKFPNGIFEIITIG